MSLGTVGAVTLHWRAKRKKVRVELLSGVLGQVREQFRVRSTACVAVGVEGAPFLFQLSVTQSELKTSCSL